MDNLNLLIPVVLMVGTMAFVLFGWWRRSSQMGPAMHRFFEETGYRIEGAPDATVETSINMWQANWQAQKRAGVYDLRLVRAYREIWVRHRVFMGYEDETRQKYIMSASWRSELQNPRVGLHVAEKSYSGVRAFARDMFSNVEHDWAPAYPTKIKTHIPELDARFNVWGQDEAAVRQVLADDWVRVALLNLSEVDLIVTADGIQLNDPEQKNLRAGLQGYGAMAAGMDKLMTTSIDAHNQISVLFYRIWQLVAA